MPGAPWHQDAAGEPFFQDARSGPARSSGETTDFLLKFCSLQLAVHQRLRQLLFLGNPEMILILLFKGVALQG